MLATLAKVYSEDFVPFQLVNGRCISSSDADKHLTNGGLDKGTNCDNDPTRPWRTGILTAPFNAMH